jgi:parvulin-like peptidyl-prolyl isomerase
MNTNPASFFMLVLVFATTGLAPTTLLPVSQLFTATAQEPSAEEVREALATEIPEDPASVIAVVGKTPILVGDIAPRVEGRIREITGKSEQTPSEQELKYMRSVLFRSLLSQTIQLKMLRESFLLSQVGTQSADKRDDAEVKLQSRARQMFAESELPKAYKRHGVNNIDDLDKALQLEGSSFESTKRDFIDQMLAYLYRSDAIEKDPEVTLIEIQNYYNDHKTDYQVKAQVRYEQLTASFEKSGGRDAAKAKINEMGKEAFFGGSMQAVAKAKSDEPFASRGGLHEWTNRGSLVSVIAEEQLFTLPIGEMSEVVEDDDGMHIFRVLGRRPEGVRPLSELQDEIRDILKKQKINEATKRVTKEMARRVPVWTIFPDDIEGSIQLAVAKPSTDIR